MLRISGAGGHSVATRLQRETRRHDTNTALPAAILGGVKHWKSILIGVLAAPLAAMALLSAAWWALGPDRDAVSVAPNVSLAGIDVSNLDDAELDTRLEDIEEQFAQTPVAIATDSFTLETTAGDLGWSVDVERTKAAALALSRRDPGPLAPIRWAKSFLTDRTAPVALDTDRDQTASTLRKLEGDRRTIPVEPQMVATADAVTMTNGEPGRELDVDAIIAAAPARLLAPGEPIRITTDPVETNPQLDDATVQAVVDEAKQLADQTIRLKFGDSSLEVTGKDFQEDFQLVQDAAGVRLGLNSTNVAKRIAAAIDVPSNPTGVRFALANGIPTPLPGQDAVVCCGETAPDDIVEALLAGQTEVDLGTRTVTAAQGVEWANSLGIKEMVGEFTTRHPCCANRVKNIHRIADLTHGVIIAPGETFSANDFVGRRTPENGFFLDGVISNGKFEKDYGGGVSQWATTTFNAAFFAGLDIPEHKAHSIYISRYPFGREATLAYPSVDLKIRNNTPHGVVMIPSYTDTSITVQLWGTRFAFGKQTAISKTSGCGSVTVTRTRLFVDGRSDTQKYGASYDCDPPDH